MDNSLDQKRILVTDCEEELAVDLIYTLAVKSAAVFILVKEFEQLDSVQIQFPAALPILLDVQRTNNDEVHAQAKLFASLPAMHHIVNFSGDAFLKPFSKTGHMYKYKAEEINENKFKPNQVVAKLIEAGKSGLMINVSTPTNSKNFTSVLKEKFNSTFLDSKTSIKEMFSNTSSQKVKPVSSNSAKFSATSRSLSLPQTESVPSQQQPRHLLTTSVSSPPDAENNRFKLRLPSSKSFNLNGSSTTTSTAHGNFQHQTLTQENDKVRKVLHKVHHKSRSKWAETLKSMKKKETHKTEALNRDVNTFKKKQKASQMQMNEQANSQTLSRTTVLTSETANQIINSREARIDKEISRNAEKKLLQGKEQLDKDFEALQIDLREKHYSYIVQKQIKKLRESQNIK